MKKIFDFSGIGKCKECGKKIPFGSFQSFKGICFDCMGV